MTRFYADTGLPCDPVEDCPTRGVGLVTCRCAYLEYGLRPMPTRQTLRHLVAADATEDERLAAAARTQARAAA